jgi:hypothetical protein
MEAAGTEPAAEPDRHCHDGRTHAPVRGDTYACMILSQSELAFVAGKLQDESPRQRQKTTAMLPELMHLHAEIAHVHAVLSV